MVGVAIIKSGPDEPVALSMLQGSPWSGWGQADGESLLCPSPSLPYLPHTFSPDSTM